MRVLVASQGSSGEVLSCPALLLGGANGQAALENSLPARHISCPHALASSHLFAECRAAMSAENAGIIPQSAAPHINTTGISGAAAVRVTAPRAAIRAASPTGRAGI